MTVPYVMQQRFEIERLRAELEQAERERDEQKRTEDWLNEKLTRCEEVLSETAQKLGQAERERDEAQQAGLHEVATLSLLLARAEARLVKVDALAEALRHCADWLAKAGTREDVALSETAYEAVAAYEQEQKPPDKIRFYDEDPSLHPFEQEQKP